MAAGDVKVGITTNKSFGCNIFDGIDDYIAIPLNNNHLGVNFQKGFTFSIWCYFKTTGEGVATDSSFILDKGTTGTGYTLSLRQDNGKMQFWIIGANKITTTLAVTLREWAQYTITCAFDGTVNIYKNTVVASAGGMAGTDTSIISQVGDLRIGNIYNGTTRTVDGGLHKFKLWNKVLSAEEISTDYQNKTVAPENLVHYFKLDGSGDYTDYGKTGVTATNSGSTAGILDETIAAAIKAQRVGANDKWLLCKCGDSGQVIHTQIEA